MTQQKPFAGASRAYIDEHLANRRCLDDSPHDGTPCLINDPSRAAEAWHLLTHIPEAANGEGVIIGPVGRPMLRTNQERRRAS